LIIWQPVEKPVYDTYVLPSQILNPFTGEIQTLPPLPETPFRRIVSISPGARYAIYTKAPPEETWILYDYQRKVSIGLFPADGSASFDWARDGSQIAVFTNPNSGPWVLNLVEPGATIQWRRLKMEEDVWPGYPKWSPNGRYLAYTVSRLNQTTTDNYAKVVILDPVAQRAYSFCALAGSAILTWSKDSRFLAWLNPPTQTEPSAIVVLDVESGLFAHIPEYSLLDWGVYAKGLTLQNSP
jgi:hypothetical protein